MSVDISVERVIELETRVSTLETRLGAMAGVLAALQPVGRLMVKYGVSEAQQVDVYRIINEMSARLDHSDRPSFTEFEERVMNVVGKQTDRRFIELLVEALKIERPDSERLYDHFTRAMELLRT